MYIFIIVSVNHLVSEKTSFVDDRRRRTTIHEIKALLTETRRAELKTRTYKNRECPLSICADTCKFSAESRVVIVGQLGYLKP